MTLGDDMKLRFTVHARDKFFTLERHNFRVTEEVVIEAVSKPERLEQSRNDRFIAEKTLDEGHLIRVIYEIRGEEIVIITFYPARRSRYED